MNSFQSALVRLCRIGTGLGFLVLIFAVLTQVIGRSVVNSSPSWTEELTRYAMLWTIACGAGLSFRSGDLVNVDILSEALPGRWPWIMRLTSAIATVGLCAVLIWPAWRYTAIGARQTSPVLKVGMNWIHASILVLLVLLMVFALLRIVEMLRGTSDGRPVINPDKQA
ncbi:TRAP transporter small permease [Roseitranquillus sediminis]|uniref:TRAP transporter small permease n=1 Tax=Roseitranquillus sediminis TaxID=2809051 RepID=UPI001D0C8E17|nr:TRAP transporter small permease [Roseitranquillus sediminis]MBM9594273.1 TRAP transporter small permease [Roseitranquillus sediminis]